jgi:hypothetical protein
MYQIFIEKPPGRLYVAVHVHVCRLIVEAKLVFVDGGYSSYRCACCYVGNSVQEWVWSKGKRLDGLTQLEHQAKAV